MKKIIVVILIVLCSATGKAQIKYGGEAGMGYSFGLGTPGFNKYMLYMVHGVNIKKYAFIGVGLALDAISSSTKNTMLRTDDLWLRANIKLEGICPLNDKVSLFCGGDIGVGSHFVMDVEYSDGIGISYKGGLYFATELGCRLKLGSFYGIGFAAGYYCYNMTQEITFNRRIMASSKFYAGSIGFNINLYW